MRQYLQSYTTLKLIIAMALLATLIIMPDICFTGARLGLTMWFEILLPTLFPFFMITRLIIRMNLCPKPLLSFYPIFVGLLAGYPTGALTCSDMYTRGQLSRHKAQSYLIVCNNISPGFLISFVACQCLGIPDKRYLIWICVIASSAAVAALYYFLCGRHIRSNRTSTVISSCGPDTYQSDNTPLTSIIEDTMISSFEILAIIGGYVTLFSIFANVIMQLPIGSMCTVILSGIMEVTTGCGLITGIPATVPIHIKSAAAAALCGFGGISAILQTKSAIRESDLSITLYSLHKVLCGILSCILCYVIIS